MIVLSCDCLVLSCRTVSRLVSSCQASTGINIRDVAYEAEAADVQLLLVHVDRSMLELGLGLGLG